VTSPHGDDCLEQELSEPLTHLPRRMGGGTVANRGRRKALALLRNMSLLGTARITKSVKSSTRRCLSACCPDKAISRLRSDRVHCNLTARLTRPPVSRPNGKPGRPGQACRLNLLGAGTTHQVLVASARAGFLAARLSSCLVVGRDLLISASQSTFLGGVGGQQRFLNF